MQSRVIGQLARKLRSTHRKTKSWETTAREHCIFNPAHQPNKSLARRIAIEEYEPGPKLWQRLIDDGVFAFNKKPKQKLYADLLAEAEAHLAYLLEHREDFR